MRGCEVSRPRRCAMLIGDNPQLGPFRSQAEHGEHEVRTLAAVEPAGAHDEVVRALRSDRDLAVHLVRPYADCGPAGASSAMGVVAVPSKT